MEKWYLLFDGQSSDGLGQPQYVGRTTDVKVAKAHLKKIKKNPYSTGKVQCFTDNKQIYIFDMRDFDK